MNSSPDSTSNKSNINNSTSDQRTISIFDTKSKQLYTEKELYNTFLKCINVQPVSKQSNELIELCIEKLRLTSKFENESFCYILINTNNPIKTQEVALNDKNEYIWNFSTILEPRENVKLTIFKRIRTLITNGTEDKAINNKEVIVDEINVNLNQYFDNGIKTHLYDIMNTNVEFKGQLLLTVECKCIIDGGLRSSNNFSDLLDQNQAEMDVIQQRLKYRLNEVLFSNDDSDEITPDDDF